MPQAVGHRHLIVSSEKTIPCSKWLEIYNSEFVPKGFKEIHREFAPDPNPGNRLSRSDNSRMRTVLGIEPIDFKDTIVDTVNSFIEYGLISK